MVTVNNANVIDLREFADLVSLIDTNGNQVAPYEDQTPRPIAVDTVFNTSVNANTDIITDATPTNSPSIFRVTVAVDTAAVFKATITRGGTTEEYNFNEGSKLSTDSVFTFDHPVRDASTINYQVETGGTIRVLNVDEIAVAGP